MDPGAPSLNPERDFEGVEEAVDLKVSDLTKDLTDAGKYAYAGLCALKLHQLFDYDFDKGFREGCLSTIVKHLDLPAQVEPVMGLLLSGAIENSVESFMEILKTEPALDGQLKFLLHDLIALAVHEGEYDARWRVLLRELCLVFETNFEEMELYEITVVHCLSKDLPDPSEDEKAATRKRQRILKVKRYALIGLASLGGGALIGVTGGLAAPMLGAILGGSALTMGTAAGIAVTGALFGAAGAGLTGYKMNKRVGEIEEFAFGVMGPVRKLDTYDALSSITTPHLDITIAISGWIQDESEDNFTKVWSTLCSSHEQYYLRYESSYLLELGRAMEYFANIALSIATQEALKYTVLSGLVTAIAWPAGLIGLASVLDNPWGVCCRRSAQVGKHLADVLLAREHGRRPVTLIGYSLGARVIYYCLREMSTRDKCEGVVQDAYLLGAPCSANPDRWKDITRVVSGKIVNGYCKSDWLLTFLYRTLSWPAGGVAGLQPIAVTHPRIENVNLSEIVKGHKEYPDKMSQVLKAVGVRVVEEEDPIPSSRSHTDTLNVPEREGALKQSLSDSVLTDKHLCPS